MGMLFAHTPVLIRGGGDLATGIVYRLHKAGFPVIVTELPHPLVVRRTVAVATAVRQGRINIEDLKAERVDSWDMALECALEGRIPVWVAPMLPATPLPLAAIVDARMAKRNIDTNRDQAALVMGLGPGFSAGADCHAVIETMRGHTLGRVIWKGAAIPNTGTPGIVAGKGKERVLRAPVDGQVGWHCRIGELVSDGQLLGEVAARPIAAPFNGVVRGLIDAGTTVNAGQKIGDVDARGDVSACFTISDKALAIGGGVLEALLVWLNARERN